MGNMHGRTLAGGHYVSPSADARGRGGYSIGQYLAMQTGDSLPHHSGWAHATAVRMRIFRSPLTPAQREIKGAREARQ